MTRNIFYLAWNILKRKQKYSSIILEKYKYASKIINFYIVYDLDSLPKRLLRNFTFKNCSNFLFRATNVVKDHDKEKYVYSGYVIAFDGKGLWGFNDAFPRNVIML